MLMAKKLNQPGVKYRLFSRARWKGRPMTATTQFDFSAGDPITRDPPVPSRPSRGLTRYLLAICIGVAASLAWQAYGQAAKQMIARWAPDLGWSPEAKQRIASWVEQFGETKPLPGAENTAVRQVLLESAQAAAVGQTAPDKVAKGSIDSQQIQQIALDVAALRQILEQVAASQRDMAAEIHNLLVTDMDMFLKIPASPPAATSRKSTPIAPPSRMPNRRTDLISNQSIADSFRN
jgi:hypothetical protein